MKVQPEKLFTPRSPIVHSAYAHLHLNTSHTAKSIFHDRARLEENSSQGAEAKPHEQNSRRRTDNIRPRHEARALRIQRGTDVQEKYDIDSPSNHCEHAHGSSNPRDRTLPPPRPLLTKIE